ncbi:hypothetical protein CPB83DRAFT_897620 [Crepidotus variabilis]|uniref:Uncharacterized protein n=1 Tax=Crepidotus variabilis TaxID=179855 RepID=A0A9P6JLH4_9AGAR|nr:hypothetical protein CPB83DRAFT_897620 [Crepidotus variabilis]
MNAGSIENANEAASAAASPSAPVGQLQEDVVSRSSQTTKLVLSMLPMTRISISARLLPLPPTHLDIQKPPPTLRPETVDVVELNIATTTATYSSALFNPFPISSPDRITPTIFMQFHGLHPDPLPFSSVESSTESDPSMSLRSNKRRRMSTDSASEPPSSAGSYSSYGTSGGDGYTSAGSTTSTWSSNMFSHPPMMPQNHSDSETFWHPLVVLLNTAHHAVGVRSSTSPPVAHKSINSNINSATTASTPSSSSLHTNDSSPMDYLQAPMIQDDVLFSAYLHPLTRKRRMWTTGLVLPCTLICTTSEE